MSGLPSPISVSDMNSVPLQGLHLLVTRPQEQGESWAKQLLQLGAEVSLQPMMVIAPLNDSAAERQIINRVLAFDEYQKAIFISQNAVNYGMQWIDQYWPELPSGVEFLAIGRATAELLNHNEQGLLMVSLLDPNNAAMNSEALLSDPRLHHIQGEKIVIFRGQGGRQYLGEQLRQRGAHVDYCELYQRKCVSTTPQPLNTAYRYSQHQVITVVHSGETLNNVCSSIDANDLAWMKQQVLLLPGDRVAKQAQALGFTECIVAKNATHDSMIEALIEWRKQ